MQVIKRERGIVQRVVLLDDTGGEVVAVNRFLSHLTDSNYSPNTFCAYAYDLAHLVRLLDHGSVNLKWPHRDGGLLGPALVPDGRHYLLTKYLHKEVGNSV